MESTEEFSPSRQAFHADLDKRLKAARDSNGKPVGFANAEEWRVHAMSFSEDWDVIPPDYLIEGLIEKGDTVLFAGPPGAGKTYMTQDLVMAILDADREGFLGHGVNEHGRVVVFDNLENRGNKVRNRLKLLGGSPELLGNDKLVYIRKSMSFANAADLTLMREVVAAVQPTLVVFDSYVGFLGEKEAGPEHRAAFNDGVRTIADLGPAVVVLDHVSKVSGTAKSMPDPNFIARGTGDKGAAFDRIIAAKVLDNEDEESIVVAFGRAKDDRHSRPLLVRRRGDYITKVWHDAENYSPEWQASELDTAVLDALADAGTATFPELTKELNEDRRRISEAADRLEGVGQVEVDRSKRPYRVTRVLERV
jgi:AAA domain